MSTYSQLLRRVRKKKVGSSSHKRALADLVEYAQIQRKDLQSSYEKKRLEAKHTGKMFVSPQQEEVAQDIVDEFNNGKSLVTLIAQPQWGKTGTILTAAYYLCSRGEDEQLTDPNKVYIITGMSDTEWEKQTRERMLPQFENNIYHRARINLVVPKLSAVRNALIIIDECHYASKNDQTIKQALEQAGLLNIHHLQKKNIHIIQTSATPDNVLIDSHSWNEHHAMVRPKGKSSSYTSFADLLTEGRIKESLDLSDPCEAQELFEAILSFSKPRYHIIRIPRKSINSVRSEIVDNLEAFCYDYSIKLLFHDSHTKIKDIDKLLAQAPTEHTVIVITDYWRAAKTLDDTYVGVVHERVVQSPNSTTVVQSLAGRMVGHNRKTHGGPMIFTYRKAVEQYTELVSASYDYKDIAYHSTGVHSNGKGKITVKDSYAHECKGVEHKYIESDSNEYDWRLFFGKNPRRDAEKFVREVLQTELPKKKKVNGFYVQNDVKDPLYVYSKYFKDDQPYNKRIFKGLSGNNAKKKTNWRQYALYRDPKDPNSLIWFVCWRRNAY